MKKRFENVRLKNIKNLGIFSWSVIGALIILALIIYLVYLIRSAIIPLIFAMAIAYILVPLVNLLKKKMRKIFAVILVYLLFLSIIFVVFFFIIPIVVDQSRIFFESIPVYLDNLTKFTNQFLEESVIIQYIENIIGTDVLPKDTSAITSYLISEFDFANFSIFQQATTITRYVLVIVLNLIIGPLLGFYILKDLDIIVKAFIKITPPRYRIRSLRVINIVNNVLGQYVRGQLLASVIVGILSTIALLILRVEFAFLLGFIAGLFNIIPFIGPYIGAIPAVLAALFISPLKALLVILSFIIIQQIDSYLIWPNIMKRQIGVHPGVAIFSLLAGGALFGWLGLILAVPIVAITQELLKYYLMDRKKFTNLRN
jgi:predicted PurR-regulated permease PerM